MWVSVCVCVGQTIFAVTRSEVSHFVLLPMLRTFAPQKNPTRARPNAECPGKRSHSVPHHILQHSGHSHVPKVARNRSPATRRLTCIRIGRLRGTDRRAEIAPSFVCPQQRRRSRKHTLSNGCFLVWLLLMRMFGALTQPYVMRLDNVFICVCVCVCARCRLRTRELLFWFSVRMMSQQRQ